MACDDKSYGTAFVSLPVGFYFGSLLLPLRTIIQREVGSL
jgi:hypothetical protein